jgi:DNA repair exonuclease SbcCD ATPase subunit
MNCTTAVFTLMSGTALLSFATIYTYNRNILSDIKLKMSNLNVALTSLQAERSDLINKSNDMYVETATKSVMADNYKAELDALRETVHRLQSDNELLKSENNMETLASQKEEMSVMTLTINRLHFDKQVLEAENKKQLGDISEKMTQLEQENALLKAENSKEELATLTATINRLQFENNRLKMDSNSAEFESLKETVARLQNDNELLINAYRQMEKRVYA